MKEQLLPVTFNEADVVIRFNKFIIKFSKFSNYLQISIGRAIIQCNKLVIAKSAYPSHYCYFLALLAPVPAVL